jgi:CheY-like chemotaxis protein
VRNVSRFWFPPPPPFFIHHCTQESVDCSQATTERPTNAILVLACVGRASRSTTREEAIKKKRIFRVLIIEDHELWQHFIPTLFQHDPEYQVIGVSADGLDGLQRAQESMPDLVLIDVGLPFFNGIETACRIREVCPNSRIIFFSENSDPETVRTAFAVGAHGYILKSDAAVDLLPSMRAVLLGKQIVSDSLANMELQYDWE